MGSDPNPVPGAITGLTDVTALSGGVAHSLALRADGTVWNWGTPEHGQLGNGSTASGPPRTTPLQVAGLSNVTAIADGWYHSLALRADTTVWGWGAGFEGQLGPGSDDNNPVATQIWGIANVKGLAAGFKHSLAVKQDGTVWAWGNNEYGQLGVATPGQIKRVAPGQVPGPTGIVAVATNTYTSVALGSNGTVWDWGGDDATAASTTPVQIVGLGSVIAIAAGYSRTLALKSDGTIWTWSRSAAPTQISGLADIVALASSGQHSLFLARDGAIWALGRENNYGQLGDGTTAPQTAAPVRVRGLGPATIIGVGSGHSLAVAAPPEPGSTPSPSPSPSPSPLPPGVIQTLTVPAVPPEQGTIAFSREGNSVTLRATPTADFLFRGWRIGENRISTWANPVTITLTNNLNVVAAFAPRQTFGDATPDQTGATEAIAQLATRGVIKGCDQAASPPLFCPTDPTLRAQMAVLIVRALGWGGENPANPFSDRNGVDDELWQAVAILAVHNVANGLGDGTYGTTSPVLNAQVISFVTRAMVAQGYWRLQADDGTIYPNVSADSGHRQDLVTYVHYAGVVRGTNSAAADFIGWDAASSRAYFAFVLWQAFDSYFGVDEPNLGGYYP